MDRSDREDSVHPGTIQSVRLATQVLQAMARQGREMGSTEIGAMLGEHKAKVHRYLATLTEVGLVTQSPSTGKYRLGWGLVYLGQEAIRQNDLVATARPFMQELMEVLRETVILHVWDGHCAVVAELVLSNQPVNVGVQLGSRLDPHCSAAGKVFLAFLPDALAAIRNRSLRALTPATIVDQEQLQRDLAAVQARGYSLMLDELLEGIGAISAPVFGYGGRLQAALTVVGVSRRFEDPARQTDIAEALLARAAAVSLILGYEKDS